MYNDASAILQHLDSMRNEDNIAGMARFGINSNKTLGISVTQLRKIAKKIGINHPCALDLYHSGIHEAKILASMIADQHLMTEEDMNQWVQEFDSWDVCDQVCLNLFRKTAMVHTKIHEWCQHDREFVKRAGFALIAILAVHDKKAPDKYFENFFPLLKHGAQDERNFVKKAVSWAMRQIGKRNDACQEKILQLATEMKAMNTKSTKWIASDVTQELRQ